MRCRRRHHDGIRQYLARHYGWAWLSPRGVWFFGPGPIISRILFGQYRAILHQDIEQAGKRLGASEETTLFRGFCREPACRVRGPQGAATASGAGDLHT